MERTIKAAMRYRWVIFMVLALQYLFVYFHRVCPAIVAQDLVETFSINATSLGVLASGYFYPYVLMQVPVGLLADSWGSRKTVTFFSLLAGAGALMFGLSPNFGMATASRIVVGLGLSGIFVPAMKTLAEWFRPREYAKISGALMAAGGIGWLSASTPLALAARSFGWRAGFIAIGVITLLFSILTWFLVVDSPKKKGFPEINAREDSDGAQEKMRLLTGIKMVFSTLRFWPLAAFCFCNGAILFSFNGLWAGPYLRDIYGLSTPAIGNILSMVAIAMVVGSPLLGYLSDNILGSRKKVLFGCSLVTAIEWAFFYFFYQSLSVPVLYALFLVIGICIGASIVICFTATKELFPLEMAGTSVSCVNIFGFVGGIIYQPLIGHFMDIGGKVDGRYLPQGYKTAFLLLFATSIAYALCTLFMKEKPKD
ncbi:MAG: MFS transporter [Syntrophorhabdaceae bacterium]|jgi:sugar phosphate permease|nr:MFS transporter [Syntrophorhabdaceae bacterium]MDD5242959.1 MFS transporter [Syntrophorhabdaceae bacterium]